VGEWIAILLPFVLLLARLSGLVVVMPIFGWQVIPGMVRAGLALLLTVFFAASTPPAVAGEVHWAQAAVLVAREATIGLALGLAARLIYLAIQQGGLIAAQQMGFSDAGVIDPDSGEDEAQPLGTLLEMTFALLFLAAGGHHLLVGLMHRGFQVFPVAGEVDVRVLTEAVIQAGSAMMVFALKLAAPVLAGFLILAVLLCILSRVLPEMNILMESFPLRVGAGLVLSAALMPTLNVFTHELAGWMSRFLIG